ncbi:unnamed protein product [Caenorhabditis brenneri]
MTFTLHRFTMNLFWLFFVFLFILPTSNAKSFYADPVTDKGTFSPEYKTKFLKNSNILNKLLAEKYNLTYTPDEVITENIKSNEELKPMENPYLFEGDIILNDEQWEVYIENAREDLRSRQISKNESPSMNPKKRVIMSDPKYRWTFPIPFHINSTLNANLIMSVIKRYEQETCVRFKRQNQLPADKYILGLEIIKGTGCWSYVGKQRIRQQVSIGIGCESVGTIWHEIAHALGVYHEQSRYDRDKYILINPQNVIKDDIHNFEKQSADSTSDYGIGYDYGSVMHYDTYAFSKNNQPTMMVRDPIYTDTPGTYFGPSFGDVKGINAAYCSSTCSNTLRCVNGGYINPSNCNGCNCPPGFGGKLCEVKANPGSCGNVNLMAISNTQKINAAGKKTCYFLITAPAGRRVFFKVTDSEFRSSIYSPCTSNYLEIFYKQDFTKSGARTCFSYRPLPINLSEGELLLVMYQGDEGSHFSMDYRAA